MRVLGNYDGSDPNSMVKFVESHDSYLSEDKLGYTRIMSDEDLMRAYSSLTGYYDNTLFYVRPWSDTWKRREIKEANNKKRILR